MEQAEIQIPRNFRDAFQKSPQIRMMLDVIEARQMMAGIPSGVSDADKAAARDVVRDVALPIVKVSNGKREAYTEFMRRIFPDVPDLTVHKIDEPDIVLVDNGQGVVYLQHNTITLDLLVIRSVLVAAADLTFRDSDLNEELAELRRLTKNNNNGRREHPGVAESTETMNQPKRDAKKASLSSEQIAEEAAEYFHTLATLNNAQLTQSDDSESDPADWYVSATVELNEWVVNFQNVLRAVLAHEMGHRALGHQLIMCTPQTADRRAELELQADIYASLLIGSSDLEAQGVGASMREFSEMMLGKPVSDLGQQALFDTAYQLSGFDMGTLSETCYPTVKMRKAITATVDKKISEIRTAAKQACINKSMVKHQAWMNLMLELWGEAEVNLSGNCG